MADLLARITAHHRTLQTVLTVLAEGPVEGMTGDAVAAQTFYATSTVLKALQEGRKAGLVRSERARRPGRRAGWDPVVWILRREDL